MGLTALSFYKRQDSNSFMDRLSDTNNQILQKKVILAEAFMDNDLERASRLSAEIGVLRQAVSFYKRQDGNSANGNGVGNGNKRMSQETSPRQAPTSATLPTATVTTDNSPFLRRKFAIAIIFALTNIIAWHAPLRDVQNQVSIHDSIALSLPDFSHLTSEEHSLTTGVGLVTTDGMWKDDPNNKWKNEDIKILGFTDRNYLPIARRWYERLTKLGYTEHWIVAHDDMAYNPLVRYGYRVIPCFIKNPDFSQPVKGLWKQIMSARLRLTRDLLKNGTHVLVTDVDNVFSRYVPLYGFLEEGYDAYHSFEMRYPMHIYREFGFVVCSGHQFLRSSPETLKFMDLIMQECRWGKCDDQVVYNNVFFHYAKIKWDGMETPNHEGALRINTTHPENANLLVESVTGRSMVTNHTIKIWDRDFAWRLAKDIPEFCPSINNWVGMPTKLDNKWTGGGTKVHQKLKGFEVWDNLCRIGRSKLDAANHKILQ